MAQSSELTPTISCVETSCLHMEAYHQHNHVEIGLRELGDTYGILGGQRVEFPLRRLSIVWGMVPHRSIQTSERALGFIINLPLPWFLSRGLPTQFVAAVLGGAPLWEPSATQEGNDLRLFGQWLRDFASDEPAHSEAAQLEVQARLLRLAVDLSRAGLLDSWRDLGPGNVDSRQLRHAEVLEAFIATHYGEPNLSAATIARAANLHERYAMKLFREAYGVTLFHHLMQHRLWHAQRLLATTDLPIVDVLRQAGFGSDSQFYAAFKRNCGISPRAYRHAVHQGADLRR